MNKAYKKAYDEKFKNTGESIVTAEEGPGSGPSAPVPESTTAPLVFPIGDWTRMK